RDELAGGERDLSRGLLAPGEAGAPRGETARRLLAAAGQDRDAPAGSSVRLRRAAAVLALAGLPILAVAIYLPLGSPRLPDFPLVARAQPSDGKQPLEQLVVRV